MNDFYPMLFVVSLAYIFIPECHPRHTIVPSGNKTLFEVR